MARVWDIFQNQLFMLHHGFGIEIFSFVLMSNHWHMILRAPKQNLSRAMGYFMRETSRNLTHHSGRINQTYGSRFHRSYIAGPLYFLHAYKYVYRNPVEANLSESVEAYPYSTLPGKLGLQKLAVPVHNDETLFNDPESVLRWLNREPQMSDRRLVRAALRKRVFELAKRTQTKKEN